MNKPIHATRLTAVAAALGLALAGCAPSADDAGQDHSSHEAGSSSAPSHGDAHEGHAADGGDPPKGIKTAADPKFDVGDEVVLTAGHMPGMKDADATVTGAFDTTAYAISYTPTDGGDPVKDHKWVVHEELENPGKAPLKKGTEVTVTADHMPGMKGAEATIDSSTDETVYMVDVDGDDMKMTNHKWMVESEMKSAK